MNMPFNQTKIIVYLALGLLFWGMLSGCASSLPELPTYAALAPEPEPAPEPAFNEASPKSRIGGLMEYQHDPQREYVIYAGYGGLTPIALTPGSRITGVSLGNPDGWRIDDRQSYGSGRSNTPLINVSPGPGARTTDAIVTTQAADGMFSLRLVPHKTGFKRVTFRKQAQSNPARVAGRGASQANVGASYRLRGDTVAWQPVSVRDDGRHTFVELRPGSEASGLPVVVAIGPDNESRPVNARKQGNTLVIDGVHAGGLRLSLGEQNIEARRI